MQSNVRQYRPYQTGVSILSVSISFLIVTLAVVAYLQVQKMNHDKVLGVQDEVLAARSTSELLELFRSMTGTQLNTYLFSNPAKFALGPVPLCAHINILNRNLNQLFNPDAVADLPVTLGLPNGQAALRPNRYYQVRVIDTSTLAFDDAPCGRVTAYDFAANPTKRFFVTVSLTWIPANSDVNAVRRAEVSTILPEP